jgi:hypothetical protein
MALSSRRKKSGVSVESAALRPEVVSKPRNVHPACTRASAKPLNWQVQASRSSPPTGAQRLVLGPRLCPRAHHQSRENKLQEQPATRAFRGRGDVRGRFGRVRRPDSAKWVIHAHNYGFGPVQTSQQAYAQRHVRASE